jgi:hypothetical protein
MGKTPRTRSLTILVARRCLFAAATLVCLLGGGAARSQTLAALYFQVPCSPTDGCDKYEGSTRDLRVTFYTLSGSASTTIMTEYPTGTATYNTWSFPLTDTTIYSGTNSIFYDANLRVKIEVLKAGIYTLATDQPYPYQSSAATAVWSLHSGDTADLKAQITSGGQAAQSYTDAQVQAEAQVRATGDSSLQSSLANYEASPTTRRCSPRAAPSTAQATRSTSRASRTSRPLT